jgi:hypothetical protein
VQDEGPLNTKIGQDRAIRGNPGKVIFGDNDNIGRVEVMVNCAPGCPPPWTGSAAAGPAPGPAANFWGKSRYDKGGQRTLPPGNTTAARLGR